MVEKILSLEYKDELPRLTRPNIVIPNSLKGKFTIYSKLTKEEIIKKYPSTKTSFALSTMIISKEDEIKDDLERSLTWSELYKFASYYFDSPKLIDRYRYLEEMKFHFSGILSQSENPHEHPNLENRRSLVDWVCQKHNSFLRMKNSENSVDCNVDRLLKFYGPNEKGSKLFLGAQDFFI